MASCFNNSLSTGKLGKVSVNNSLVKKRLHKGFHSWQTTAKTSYKPAARVQRLLTRATRACTTKVKKLFVFIISLLFFQIHAKFTREMVALDRKKEK